MRKVIALVFAAMLALPVTAQSNNQEKALVPIIMYHSVSKIGACDYVVTPLVVEQDFAYLHSRGYKAVPLSALEAYACGRGDLPEKSVVITFDDGFYNNLFYVLPLLEKYDFYACVSVVGKLSENESDKLKRSPVYSYLSEKEIAELEKSGRVEIGNHSYDMHTVGKRKGAGRRRGESDKEYERALKEDTQKCEEIITRACGERPKIYAYPFGCRSAFSDKVLHSLGYSVLLGCEEGVNELHRGESLPTLKRYNRPAKTTTERFFARMKVS